MLPLLRWRETATVYINSVPPHNPATRFRPPSLGNGGVCCIVFARNRDTAVTAEGNGDLQTQICFILARSENTTMSHIVESYPLTKLNGGLSRLHSADEDVVSCLTTDYSP